ncbi:elongation factor G-binding protein [Siminovitchia acidinfaciens]|uniref:Elongation factor G-binding protein n=1 Tax=Siminovitchia acidinfaciens TaxID=2321395 RepID=A0A429Y4D7_9BACI|nr:FusB/FusC family EF-G-binding protein [Siminovitchia acidinfaciens]RST76248.1 elongation factor G-binding protein [Siminovitchia acidinfaciens]
MTSHIEVQPFIRCYQYNFIRFQVENLVNAHSAVKDPAVLKAVKYGALDKIIALFPELHEYHQIFNKVTEIEDGIHAKHFLTGLKPYIIPFKPVTEKTVGKLFPKAGKLKLQFLKEIDFTEVSYLGWYDIRSDKKFLIFDYKEKLMGIQGTFRHKAKGICSLCNRHGEVGMFMANVKSGKETYTNRGNYICDDSHECNQNIQSLNKLESFIEVLKN